MKIKRSLLFVFMVFMLNGGHSRKAPTRKTQNIITLQKNGKTALINIAETDEIDVNEYAYERWLVFLNAWLNRGKDFIYHLAIVGHQEVNNYRNHAWEGLR